MAGSPRRIYRNLSDAQLLQIRDAALDRIINGSFTNLSGAQKSSTREFVDPQDMLFEAEYEIGSRAGTLAPSRTYQDFSGLNQEAQQ